MNIGKYIDYIIAKIKILKQQKVFLHNGYKIKYIFEENESDKLMVVFSACTRVGIKARYNYINTLRNVKYNKLFILDDYGDDGRGVYYLGKNGDFSLAEGVSKLIKSIEDKRKTSQKIFVGSSKGGYAAMYFGFKDRAQCIIAGAPQFNLGHFLDDKGGYHIMEYICGDIEDKSVKLLDSLLRNSIYNFDGEQYPKIFLHYSKAEFTYREHIVDLKNCLDKKNIKYYEDIEMYEDHGHISNYFPKFIIKSLEKINNCNFK